MSLSKYEFLKEFPLRDEAVLGQKEELMALRDIVPFKGDAKTSISEKVADKGIKLNAQKQKQAGGRKTGTLGKVWLVRRTRGADRKLFLAQEFEDPVGILNVAGLSMLRLLNHPNLVNLVDIIQEPEGAFDYMVWDYCSRGTLSRFLQTRKNEVGDCKGGPESLCWHIIEGISSALCWLHEGIKHTFPFDKNMRHDDDWHTILAGDIHPSNIFFCNPDRAENYGTVKLGCFTSATVCVSPGPKEAPPEYRYGRSPYWPLEIIQGVEFWTPASDVFCLGAVIWHVMAGKPPEIQERLIPTIAGKALKTLDQKGSIWEVKGYSQLLKEVLYTALNPNWLRRTSARELVQRVDYARDILEEERLQQLEGNSESTQLKRAMRQAGIPEIFGRLNLDEEDNEDSQDPPRYFHGNGFDG